MYLLSIGMNEESANISLSSFRYYHYTLCKLQAPSLYILCSRVTLHGHSSYILCAKTEHSYSWWDQSIVMLATATIDNREEGGIGNVHTL